MASRLRRVTVSQYVLSVMIGALAESFLFAAFPTKLVGAIGIVIPPCYFFFKKRNLRKVVRHGHLPCWTACWNKTYFGPKGLSVGFDLPGPIFHDTFVHPKRKFWLPQRVLAGELKTPMRPSRAARRARITIARVQDPKPHAGRVPLVAPLRLRWLQLLFHTIKNRPRDWLDEIERDAQDRAAAIQQLRARRLYLEELQSAGPDLPPRHPLLANDDSESSISTIQSIMVKDRNAPWFFVNSSAERLKARKDYIATIPKDFTARGRPKKQVKFARLSVIDDEDENSGAGRDHVTAVKRTS
ncbi:Hypothetical protein D9617_59g026490 [Elsinoe fawcettii]|nr:Hypothetical protein D9617_59g026490 [Elsinoe fawcettii]